MDFAAGVYLTDTQNPIHPHPLHTVYVYTVYLFTQWRGEGGGSWTREKVREQMFSKLGRKYQYDWLNLQSINSDKHLLQSTFTYQFF